jgi:hypothetical protein
MKYLDKTGLAYFWNKIKTFLSSKLIVRYSVPLTTISKNGEEQTLEFSSVTLINGFDKIEDNNKTTLYDGDIKFLKDMTVELSGTIQPYNIKGTYITMRMFKNGTQFANARFKPASTYETYTIPIFYVKVTAGDILQVRVVSNNVEQQLNALGLNIREL